MQRSNSTSSQRRPGGRAIWRPRKATELVATGWLTIPSHAQQRPTPSLRPPPPHHSFITGIVITPRLFFTMAAPVARGAFRKAINLPYVAMHTARTLHFDPPQHLHASHTSHAEHDARPSRIFRSQHRNRQSLAIGSRQVVTASMEWRPHAILPAADDV